MNALHIDMDDMAEFGEKLNAGRVGKLPGAELNRAIADRAAPVAWLPRRVTGVWAPSACTGNCDQGDACSCGPKEAASSCTEIGADGVPSTWESADAEVLAFFGRLSLKLLKASVLIFSALLLVDALNAALSRFV